MPSSSNPEFAPYPLRLAPCSGQILPIAQNSALFAIVGNRYGGDGTTTFALPNLQDRAPTHWGTGPGRSPHIIGESGGASSVSLITDEIPSHTHQAIPSHALPRSALARRPPLPNRSLRSLREGPRFADSRRSR
ncbi:MAG: tail fiber protein [Polyangiaceae bacterium]|nr:tail fiber protein [Polyangiaceae bacterium]